MARVTYGALVTEIRGSIGGTTFQRNRYGYSVKNKSYPGNRSTPFQYGIRSALNDSVKAWATLSDANRALWESFATTNPQPCKHNPSANLTGYALFVKWNTKNKVGGGDILETPSFTLPTLPTFAPTIGLGGGDLIVNLFPSPSTLLTQCLLMVSPPVKVTDNFVDSKTRFMYETVLDGSAITITSNYIANFGAFPAVGDWVFITVDPFGVDCPYFFEPVTFKVQVS